MKNLIFTNYQGSFLKEYKTDKVGDNHMFTVQDIKITGAVTEDDSVKAGLDMKRLPYSIEEFKAKATTLKLKLIENDFSSNSNTTLVDETEALEVTTETLDAGAVGTAEKTVLTVPATSAATQGDYVILNTKNGISYAVWLSLNGSLVTPNGPLFLATTYQIRVNIVTGGTAAQNAALVKATLEASLLWSGFDTIVDNSNGTLDITASDLGNTVNTTRHNAAESGNGSFSFVVTPGTGDYSEVVEADGGTTPYTFELDESSDDLPSGLVLSSAGVISGVPDDGTDGSYDIVVKVTDVLGQTVLSGTLTLIIAA